MPIDAAEVTEQTQNREAFREIGAHQLGRVQRQPLAFAQQQQTGGVIDLPVSQHHRGDAGASELRRLQLRCAADLRENIRRSVADDPPLPIATHRDRGLAAGPSMQSTCPQSRAVAAVTIPLREAAARRRAENLDAHKSGALPRGQRGAAPFA